MAVVQRIRDAHGYAAISYRCPGCKRRHGLRLRSPGVPDPTWTWNGNADAPTVYPAVKVEGCHHMVRTGKLVFLSSSTHRLAGETIEMEKL